MIFAHRNASVRCSICLMDRHENLEVIIPQIGQIVH